MILEVDKNTFEAEVLQAPGKVVVDFYGDGCVPCAALMPHVHAFADKYTTLKFCALNTTKARRLAIAQKVLTQFEGKSVSKVEKMQVDAKTGATFSTKALIQNVQTGVKYYKSHK